MSFYKVWLYVVGTGWRRKNIPAMDSIDELKKSIDELVDFSKATTQEIDRIKDQIKEFDKRFAPIPPVVPDQPQQDPPRAIPEPEGLRWIKVDRGEPITWCFDNENSPFSNSELERELQSIFNSISSVCSVNFQQVNTTDCDIRTGFEEVDGQSGTLAFVFLPSGQTDVIEACTPQCGDIHFDQDDAENVNLVELHDILAHEAYHSMGLDHVTSETSIMNPIFRSNPVRHDINSDEYVLRELRRRYPV